jgi:hypothetical protein
MRREVLVVSGKEGVDVGCGVWVVEVEWDGVVFGLVGGE